jgi:hypothetical protein
MNRLTRVKLWMWRVEGVDFPIKISIRKDLQNGEDLVIVQKNSNEIFTRDSWIEFDFNPDIIVEPDETYYIVATCNDGDNDNCYAWVYGEYTAYTRGSGWASWDKGLSWLNYIRVDQCFETWGHNANLPPNTPKKPSGVIKGEIYTTYFYSSETTDPEKDKIYYLFDWGDGTNSSWLGPYDSGVEASTGKQWKMSKEYQIKVKAKDDPDGDPNTDDGQGSEWSDPLVVLMPKSKLYYKTLLLKFFDDYSNFFPLLRNILWVR